MNKSEENCGTCRFLRQGKCHAEPPSMSDEGRAEWPFVTNPTTNFCGGWEPMVSKRATIPETPPTPKPPTPRPKDGRGGHRMIMKVCEEGAPGGCGHYGMFSAATKFCPKCGKKVLARARDIPSTLESIEAKEPARPLVGSQVIPESVEKRTLLKCQGWNHDKDSDHCHVCQEDHNHNGKCKCFCGAEWRKKK